MKLKPYPKYKDSGVEWLGKIPEGWEVKRLKYVAHMEMGQSPDSSFYNKDGIGVPFLQGNADFKELYPKAQVWTTDGNKYSQENDILISVRAPVGELNISNHRYAIGRGLAALRFNKKSNFKYFYYLFIKSRNYFDSVSTGTTYTAISTDDIKNIIVTVPSIDHQSTIANYLDQKTSKIDELIKKNERLIELLKEKRRAIISQAVTKGLNPNAKMKNSGIEWLRKIPEGWEVRKLKYVAQIILGKMLQNEDTGDDQLKPYMRAQNIQWEAVDISDIKEMWLSAYEMRKYRLQRGDLLISEGGEVGRTALWNDEIEECYIQNSVHKVTVNSKKVNNKYLLFLLETYGKRGSFESIINRVSIGHLTREKLKEIPIINPPKKEQDQIATYLTQRTSQVDNLIKKIESQNENLKEHRQVIISNVVTGKLRVSDTT